jgi:hypothetical protein
VGLDKNYKYALLGMQKAINNYEWVA